MRACGMVEGSHYCNVEVVGSGHATNNNNNEKEYHSNQGIFRKKNKKSNKLINKSLQSRWHIERACQYTWSCGNWNVWINQRWLIHIKISHMWLGIWSLGTCWYAREYGDWEIWINQRWFTLHIKISHMWLGCTYLYGRTLMHSPMLVRWLKDTFIRW